MAPKSIWTPWGTERYFPCRESNPGPSVQPVVRRYPESPWILRIWGDATHNLRARGVDTSAVWRASQQRDTFLAWILRAALPSPGHILRIRLSAPQGLPRHASANSCLSPLDIEPRFSGCPDRNLVAVPSDSTISQAMKLVR